MDIPRELIYVLAGGIGLYIIKEVFKFVKWAIEKISVRNGRTNSQDETKIMMAEMPFHAEKMLETLVEKIDGVAKCMNSLNNSFGIHKTKLEFVENAIKKQNGSLGTVTKALTKMSQEFATRLVLCDGKFQSLEKELSRKATKRKKKS